ncbi:tyrosine-type recombinase/integrase [Streptomyces sp. T028]|uniref:tyrosine-type recombinase/integrase n=1 Tax=Streptomyces sp. T028 TaxID=3394379 RepID=UPI003A836F04
MPSRTWTLGEWLPYWLEHIVKPEREHNTYAKYESKVRLYLLPHLGKKPLTKLTPAQLRALMATLRPEEAGAATRFEVLRVLRNALNRAMREELLTRNVALLVDMPKVSKDKGTAWSAREAITFLRSVRAHRLYAACVLVLVLSLRRSEVLGLRWQDIDFEAGRFTPVKQVQREKGVGLVLKTSRRSPHRPCCRYQSSAAADRLVKRAGVRRITVRLARHTCGALLAFLKVHPKVAQVILRHSQISMTMDVYTHVVGDSEREAVTMLAELLEDPLSG